MEEDTLAKLGYLMIAISGIIIVTSPMLIGAETIHNAPDEAVIASAVLVHTGMMLISYAYLQNNENSLHEQAQAWLDKHE